MIATLRRWWSAFCTWLEAEGTLVLCEQCDGMGVVWTPRAGHELCDQCRGRGLVRP